MSLCDTKRCQIPRPIQQARCAEIYLLSDKVWDFVQFSDVEWDGAGFVFAMLVHERFEVLLSPADNDD